MRQPEDDVLLRDRRDHARKAVAAARSRGRADLDHDDVLAAARERFTEVVGEAASKVSQATRDAVPSIPWAEVIGMRSRLVHAYAAVDHDVVSTVVVDDLPTLIAALDGALGESRDA